MPHPALRRTPARPRFDHGAPISAIDIRPIMFVVLILTILVLLAASPMRTHALMVDFPVLQMVDEGGDQPERLSITIDVTQGGETLFNGIPVSAPELAKVLNEAIAIAHKPAVRFAPDGNASYDAVVKTLAIIHHAGMTQPPFCINGMEHHQHFGKGDGAPFPVLLTLIPPDERSEIWHRRTEAPPRGEFDSCEPRGLASPLTPR